MVSESLGGTVLVAMVDAGGWLNCSELAERTRASKGQVATAVIDNIGAGYFRVRGSAFHSNIVADQVLIGLTEPGWQAGKTYKKQTRGRRKEQG
jgi:hypothetical protein